MGAMFFSFRKPAMTPIVALCLAGGICLGMGHTYRINEARFKQDFSVPSMPMIGNDFREVHSWARALRAGMDRYLEIPNNYPPMVTVLFLPGSFLHPRMAYCIHTLILLAGLFGMIAVAMRLGSGFGEGAARAGSVFAVGAFCVSTYPILFAIERGNSDLIVGLLCATALACLERRRLRAAGACLFFAVHLKIYPLILLGHYWARAGWRQTFGLVGLLLAGFFVIGPAPAEKFFLAARNLSASPYVWWGNHSVRSWITQINDVDPAARESTIVVVVLILMATYVGVFLRLIARVWNSVGEGRLSGLEIGLLGMACSLMSLLPPESHDYKLGLQLFPFLVLVGRNAGELGVSERTRVAVVLTVSILVGLLLSMPFVFPERPAYPMLSRTPLLLASFFAYGAIGILGARPSSRIAPDERRVSRTEMTC